MRAIFLIMTIIGIGLWAGCDDLMEKDLSGRTVYLIAPTDSVVTAISAQTFWWEEMDGAMAYELNIVTTSFDSIVQLVLDTTISGTQFQHTLWPGQFQWRVRAVNGSSSSNYTTHTLTVDTASDLVGQTILLNTPLDGSYSVQLGVSFSWQALSTATSYRLQLSNDGFATGANVLDTVVASTFASVTLAEEGLISWRVRAEASSTVSSYSQIRTIRVDATAPAAVILWLPAHNASFVSQEFNFAWQPNTDSGSPLFDTLYVYTDSLSTLLSARRGVQGSVTDSLGVGTYFWRVRPFDEAGNSGSYSEVRKITVF